jgi:6-pyruvoyltetrahydropterin/6-carboxytetrahydropterin synthase
MMSVSLQCHFDAAHQLALPYDSPCNRRHGHRYDVEVTCSAETLEHGMVIDFNVLRSVVDEFDHCDLNERPEFSVTGLATTAENIAIVLARKLEAAVGPRVTVEEVVVRETPRSLARWRREVQRG